METGSLLLLVSTALQRRRTLQLGSSKAGESDQRPAKTNERSGGTGDQRRCQLWCLKYVDGATVLTERVMEDYLSDWLETGATELIGRIEADE